MKNIIILLILVIMPCMFDMGITDIIYALIVIVTILYHTKLKIPNTSYVNAILLIIISALFRINQYSILLFKDIGLMLIGILPMLYNAKFKINISLYNKLICAAFFLIVGSKIFDINLSINAFLLSNTGIELGTFAYLFSLLAIFWVGKNNKWVAINIFLTILSGKRIAILAIFFCVILAYIIGNNKKLVSTNIKLMLFLLPTTYLIFSYLLTQGYFDDIIYYYTGLSTDAFTMGRQQLYTAIFNKLNSFSLWGIGPGNSVDVVIAAKYGDTRMHNDFLKIYSENGAIIYCLFFYLLLKKLEVRQIPTLLMIFAIFMTTNSLIYSLHLFIYSIFLYPNRYIIIPPPKSCIKHKSYE